ncbi:MAG: preprotein translocase subunit YajC [Alphaproteobacteria bacterium]|nr:preprotein translocase subunit YajC [Alphaproteobacteria bacterium]
MLISMAHAQEAAQEATEVMVAQAPSAGSALMWNIGLIAILVAMFYFLLIRPQQKRFAEHKTMLDGLKKGDAVVTAGGLVGKIDEIKGDDEVVLDLGHGTKVTALRSTIQEKKK